MTSSQESAATSHGSINLPPTQSMSTRPIKSQSALRWSKRRAVQRHLRLIPRLARMSPKELAQRVARSLSKRLGIAAALPTPQTAASYFAQSMQSQGSRTQDFLIEQFDRSFFLGPSSRPELTDKIRSIFPNADVKICRLAEYIDSAGLPYLGQKVKIAAGEIDWQADPKSGKRCWTTGTLDEAEAINCKTADVKYVWEFNRHQFLPILGRAYWLSGEERYAQQAVGLIDDWIKNNPVGLGVNWCSHLEVAMRSISWLWTMPFLLALPNLDESFLQRWLASIESHYHHLRRNLSVYTDPTNHLIGEATALWMLCVCFPSLPNSQKEATRALYILTREVERQIGPDGVNREQATSYHRFVLDFYLQILVMATRNKIALSSRISKQIELMIEFAHALAGETGQAPMIGDSDDARGVPFLELVGWDFRDTLSTGAVLYSRGEWKKSAGALAEVSIWLLGTKAIDQFNSLQAAKDDKAHAAFPDGGCYFLREKHNDNRSELIFDTGALGLWPNAAHGHADALSVLIRLNGKLILTDPGTGAYFGDPRQRDYFRSTPAHNTVGIDNLDQADLYDTFKWVNPMNVKLVDFHSSEGFTYVAAAHDGYRRLRSRVNHTRAVFAAGPMGWIIVDQIEGKGEHSVKRHFNFHPQIELRQLGVNSVIAWDLGAAHGLRFDFPFELENDKFQLDTNQKGMWSGEYGKIEGAARLVVETTTSRASNFVTLVSPIFGENELSNISTKPAPEIKRLGEQNAFLCEREWRHSNSCHTEQILVNPNKNMVSLQSGHACNSEFAYVQNDANSTIPKAFLVGQGSHFIGKNFNLRCAAHDGSVCYSKEIK
jgi:Heparinase II/III-like protein/Heparinase II/III N-terminus